MGYFYRHFTILVQSLVFAVELLFATGCRTCTDGFAVCFLELDYLAIWFLSSPYRYGNFSGKFYGLQSLYLASCELLERYLRDARMPEIVVV